MVLSDETMQVYIQRLLLSRMRLLCNHGFFGLLLMHMKYGIDENTETAYTDGERIVFGVDFLNDLSDSELDFVMMHEIMHVVLQHCFRGADSDYENFNIACDIVVNSNILLENNMLHSSITLNKYGESMHLTPDGQEGYNYTAEQVYGMIVSDCGTRKKGANARICDDHSKWGEGTNADMLKDAWTKRIKDSAEAIKIRDPSNSCGMLPLLAQRVLENLEKPQTDWRTTLNEFIQQDIVDYSFFPPDRRFDDGDFFLPDFNEKEERVRDILFMIDTSGSMTDKMLTAAFSEIKGAIDQFNGKLNGMLGFFDAEVTDPKPFESEDELRLIRPVGGGGTDFGAVFKYVRNRMEVPPIGIVVLTDGYAPFPAREASMGIPTLWLINNDEVNPPWGKVARIKI